MRILIAEDDLVSRNVLATVLEKCGHDVLATGSGVEAWEVMQQPDAPSMVVLDWSMPEMNGLEVCRRIRAAETGRPAYILMLAARTEKANVVEGLDAGADDYLTKPYDADELRARVRVGCRILDIQWRLVDRVGELSRALSEIRTLQGIVPICVYCKKIRHDREYWQRVEDYLQTRTEVRFTYSVCPDCADKFIRGMEEES